MLVCFEYIGPKCYGQTDEQNYGKYEKISQMISYAAALKPLPQFHESLHERLLYNWITVLRFS